LNDVAYTGITVGEMPAEDQSIPTEPATTAAFVGRALCGPVDLPVTVTSFAEFKRCFGGHGQIGGVGSAVEQFFAHGGRRAVIVRVANGATGASLTLPAGDQGLTLTARNPGSSETFRASVDYDGLDDRPGSDGSRFNLTLQRISPQTRLIDDQEIFRGLTCRDGEESNVRDVLLGSGLVRVEGTLPECRPDATRTRGADRSVSYVPVDRPGTDGHPLTDYDLIGSARSYSGLFALQAVEHFSLLYAPPLGPGSDTGAAFLMAAERFCRRRGAFLVVDPPAGCSSCDEFEIGLRRDGFRSPHLVTYFPRMTDERRPEDGEIAVGGALAGLLARNDESEHVWLPPAEGAPFCRTLRPVLDVTPPQAGVLRQHGVIALCRGADRRVRPQGDVTYSGGVLGGATRLTTERLAHFILQRVERSTRWVLFRRSERVLWRAVERQVAEFLQRLEGAGAFGVPGDGAWFVRCNSSTNTAAALGRQSVGILLGFRPADEHELRVYSLVQEPGGSRISRAAFTGSRVAAG
jgi:hypothetical protein